MYKWKSVLYIVPETTGVSEDYLVRLSGGDMTVAAWMNIGGWDFSPENPITHWRELPEQPRNEDLSDV